MKVRDVMVQQVVTITPETTYEEAARILYGNNISGAPVVDASGELVGIVTRENIFRRILQRRLFALMEKVDKKHTLAYLYD